MLRNYALFLDDTRDPPMPFEGFSMASDVVIARDFKGFCFTVKHLGCPELISFDHDLGPVTEPNGMDCAKWFINAVLDKKVVLHDNLRFVVHSMNPPGKANIESLMTQFLEHMTAARYGDVRKLIAGEESVA